MNITKEMLDSILELKKERVPFDIPPRINSQDLYISLVCSLKTLDLRPIFESLLKERITKRVVEESVDGEALKIYNLLDLALEVCMFNQIIPTKDEIIKLADATITQYKEHVEYTNHLHFDLQKAVDWSYSKGIETDAIEELCVRDFTSLMSVDLKILSYQCTSIESLVKAYKKEKEYNKGFLICEFGMKLFKTSPTTYQFCEKNYNYFLKRL